MEQITDKKLLTPAMYTALKKVADAAKSLEKYTYEKLEAAVVEHNNLVEKYDELKTLYTDKLAEEKKAYQIKLNDVKRDYANESADLKLEHDRNIIAQNTTTLNKLAKILNYSLIDTDELNDLNQTVKDADSKTKTAVAIAVASATKNSKFELKEQTYELTKTIDGLQSTNLQLNNTIEQLREQLNEARKEKVQLHENIVKVAQAAGNNQITVQK